MTKKELAATPHGFSDKFQSKKKEFFDYIKSKSLPRWHIKNNPFSVADFTFENAVRFWDFKQTLNELIGNMAGRCP